VNARADGVGLLLPAPASPDASRGGGPADLSAGLENGLDQSFERKFFNFLDS
jgi:hypothetical protein